MKKNSDFRFRIEYVLLVLVRGVINLVPYCVAALMARGLARIVFVCGFKRQRTLGRIRKVFPEKSDKEVRFIARESLANVLLIGVEMIRASRFTRKWMDCHVIDGDFYREKLQRLANEGHGVVVMIPHCGDWYMAGWAMAKYGLPLFTIGGHHRNPYILAWMNRQYGDIEVLDRDSRDTLSRAWKYLQSGRVFAIMPDLRVRKRDVEVDFLRGKANVSRAGAAFAVKAGSPIVVAALSRQGFKHAYTYLAELRPDPNATDRKAEAERLTIEAFKLMDGFVQAHPETWYWYNKRWIQDPPER